MALDASVLASGIAALEPTGDEAEAIERLVTAWSDYFAGASVAGATATPGSFQTGLDAMKAAMTGLSTPDLGSTLIQAGLTAFWVTIAPLATSIWVTAPIVLVPPIVPPVGLASLAPALDSVFLGITQSSATLQEAADQLSAVIHASAGLGALVPGSVPPAPPAPLPIL